MMTKDERNAAIEAAVASQPDPTNEKMWAHDQFKQLPVYTVPVEALVMNPDNRRFRVDRLWAQEQLGKESLDPDSDPNDALTVESLLLDTNLRVDGDRIVGKPTDDTDNLERDFVRRGQERPFWIRPDGRVRNGNRRLAMIRRVARKDGDTGLLTVEAVALAENEYSEQDVFHMEAREQLTEGYKVRYSKINYLLHLREAALLRMIVWDDPDSISEVAGTLQMEVEKSKREVERDLTAVKYMDDYLVELGAPEQYHKVAGKLEVFRAVGEGMGRIKRDLPDDAAQALQVFFAAVKSGASLETVRQVRLMQKTNPDSFAVLADEIDAVEEAFEEENPTPPHLTTPTTLGPEEEDDEDGGTDEAADVAEDYPVDTVADTISVAVDAFKTSERDDTFVLLQEAHSRLRSITDSPALKQLIDAEPKARQALQGIVDWVGTFAPPLGP
jgi:hypothetical protein